MQMTGLLMARPVGSKTPDGRNLVILFGIVAAPEAMNFKEGYQYAVAGGENGIVYLNMDTPIDNSKMARGNSTAGILCSPIWRV